MGEKAKNTSILSGKWRFIDKRLDRIGMEVEWEFTGDEVIVRDAKTGELVSRSRYTIDTAKSPHWITVEVDDSPDENAGDRRLGIFRIQQGELHLKQEITNGGERPTGFENGFVRFRRPPLKPNADQVAPSDGDKPPN